MAAQKKSEKLNKNASHEHGQGRFRRMAWGSRENCKECSAEDARMEELRKTNKGAQSKMTQTTKTAKTTKAKKVETQAVMELPLETIYVSSGREVYAPIPYHTFEVGPVSFTTTVRESETYEDCFQRVQELLNGAVQSQFDEKMRGFFDRCGQLDEYMIERGMATRKQQGVVRETSSKPQADMSQPPQQPVEKTADNMLGFTGDPVAQSDDQKPTSGQLTLLGKLATNKGVDEKKICKEIFGCEPDILHKVAMSRLLDHVNAMSAMTSEPPAAAKVGENWTEDDQPF